MKLSKIAALFMVPVLALCLVACSAPGGTSSKGCLFCLPRNDDGNEFRDYLLEVTLETSWVSDKSTWVVDEAEKPLASWMLSILRNVDAQLLAKLLVT